MAATSVLSELLPILLLVLLVVVTLTVHEAKNENSIPRLHERLLLEAKNFTIFRSPLAVEPPPSHERKWELVLVISGSSDNARRTVVDSMEWFAKRGDVSNAPDWGVVLYNGNVSQWQDVEGRAQELSIGFRVMEGRKPPTNITSRETVPGKRFLPKLQFQLQVTAWIKEYEYVWLADEDISFVNFDKREFWRRHQLAFGSKGPPTLAQPVIRGESQAYQEFNWEFWSEKSVGAVEIKIVEQQIPVVSSRFWIEYIVPRVRVLAKEQQKRGSDWGLDSVWCHHAGLYNPNVTSCAVIPVPISHLDMKTIGYGEKESSPFMKAGRGMILWMEKTGAGGLLPGDGKKFVKALMAPKPRGNRFMSVKTGRVVSLYDDTLRDFTDVKAKKLRSL